jgi:hypothetical protein
MASSFLICYLKFRLKSSKNTKKFEESILILKMSGIFDEVAQIYVCRNLKTRQIVEPFRNQWLVRQLRNMVMREEEATVLCIDYQQQFGCRRHSLVK